jgi:hypothetical protein
MTFDLPHRFWEHVNKESPSIDGCWEWMGAVDSVGYPRLSINGIRRRCHKWSYLAHYGEIPHGMLVCHTCDNRRCVNPNHLWLGTHKDNSIDAAQKLRFFNQQKTHCKNGHSYEGNTMYKPGRPTHRICTLCIKIWRNNEKQSKLHNKEV